MKKIIIVYAQYDEIRQTQSNDVKRIQFYDRKAIIAKCLRNYIIFALLISILKKPQEELSLSFIRLECEIHIIDPLLDDTLFS